MKTIIIDNIEYELVPLNNKNIFNTGFKKGDWVVHERCNISYVNRFGITTKSPSEIDYIDSEFAIFTKQSDGIKNYINGLIRVTDDDIINWIHYKHEINFNEGDIVWYKGESIRKECGEDKFKVLEFKLCRLFGENTILHSYLNVSVENISNGNKASYLTTHLELYKKEDDNLNEKIIEIDGIKYKLLIHE